MDWQNVFNETGKTMGPTLIRQAAKLCNKLDVINLCGGIPNPSTFPFESASFRLRDGNTVYLNEEEMISALQYSISTGFPQLVQILESWMKKYHNPPRWDERMIMVTSGSQQAISKSLELIISPGDYVILPQYLYAGIFPVLKPLSARYLSVETDKDGMKPEALRRQLSKWQPGEPGAPKVLYAILDGDNPTGSITAEERRKEIYKIAREYNLVIIEDDAYFFLNYEKKSFSSFLSMDVDGRVIHTESFSKILSPGIRLGWVCASKEFVTKINYCMQCTTQQPSSLSQMLVLKILQTWGEDGFERHIKKIREFYTKQRDAIVAAAKKWLTGLAEWNEPKGGMFIWIKIYGIKDSFRIMTTAMKQHGLGVLAGRFFLPVEADSPYIRVTFSAITPEVMDKAFKILASVIKEEVALIASGKLNSSLNSNLLTDLFNV